MNKNPLLRTDVYKMGHMEQYCPGTETVYSHLVARSYKTFPHTLFFGLQYYLQEYLSQKITPDDAEEFLEYRKAILGVESPVVSERIRALGQLGYWPVSIKAIAEGTLIPNKNVLLTLVNTHPAFHWAPGFIESTLLKIWYPCSVATCSFNYRLAAERAWRETVDSDKQGGVRFAVHDFGYRGDQTEEGAQISGMAHLGCFWGSDTVPAAPAAIQYYAGEYCKPLMLSVPASEHSVMCSFGREDELEAFRNMLRLYPDGIVSIVSDTYNVWDFITDKAEILKPLIMGRNGKVVFRPDSGNPELIINGDPNSSDMRERAGVLRLLGDKFGTDTNSRGYKTLNPKVGCIYGDAMFLERYKRTLAEMKKNGFAASELVIGVGGILRQFSRDSLGFAIKATYVEVDGKPREIEKDPITDPGKKSLKGLLALHRSVAGSWETEDQCCRADEQGGYLEPVFENGKIVRRASLHNVRKLVDEAVESELLREAVELAVA